MHLFDFVGLALTVYYVKSHIGVEWFHGHYASRALRLTDQ